MNQLQMKGKHVLIDGRLLAISNTGISRYTKEIIKGAIDFWGKENVTVILLPQMANHVDFNYIETKYKPFNLLHFIYFHNFLKKQTFDLLITPFYTNSFYKIPGKKYISVVHDLMYCLVPNFFSSKKIINWLGKIYYDILVKRSLKNSDAIISVSKTTAKDVLKKFNLQSEVFKEGINRIEDINNHNTNPLTKYGLVEKEYFIYVGIDRPHKNVEFMCDCFIKSRSNKKLVLCGRHHKNYNHPNIQQIGYIEDSDLKHLYSNAASFIYPSKYEGFGLPILEALSLGTKVISSNAGSLSEFDSRFIYFFNPYNESSLIKAIDSIDNFTIDNIQLNSYLKQFDWEIISKEIIHFCNNILLNK